MSQERIDGRPTYPGMYLIAAITAQAHRMKKYPSEVWQHYLDNPKDLKLLWGYEGWAEKERAKHMRRANRG